MIVNNTNNRNSISNNVNSNGDIGPFDIVISDGLTN